MMGRVLDMDVEEATKVDKDSGDPRILYVFYTNHRGVTAWRTVVPLSEVPEWYPLPQHEGLGLPKNEVGWILHVYDLDRRARRSYYLKDCHQITNESPFDKVSPPEEG